jgi:hypothetical protein
VTALVVALLALIVAGVAAWVRRRDEGLSDGAVGSAVARERQRREWLELPPASDALVRRIGNRTTDTGRFLRGARFRRVS